jgi:predicted alpha/beta hydrolase family esterase
VKTSHKNVIILHGAGPKHYRSLEDGSGDWQNALPKELGSEYHVFSPQFPSLTKPDYEEWKELLIKYLAKVKGDITFVAHSLGGAFLLKFLSEEKISLKIKALFLVATPLKTLKGFELPKDFLSLPQIKNIFLYHSMDDVEVPYAHALIFRDQLQAELKTYTDRGHYFKRKKFVDLSRDIKSLDDRRSDWLSLR